MNHRSNEVARKVARLARAAQAAGLRGVLLSAHWNVSWLTAGASNRIDISREAGAGALLIGADGRRIVLANAIEMPRLTGEALAGLDFEPVEWPWTQERADPALLPARAVEMMNGGPIGVDLLPAWAPANDVRPFEPTLARLRTLLEPEEIERYRLLGADAGRVLGTVLRRVQVGARERDVVDDLAAALCAAGTRPLVLLAAGDDRLMRYRHPIPTPQPWLSRLMVAACTERDGLVVAVSRLIAVRPVAAETARRLAAAQQVFAALLRASKPGASAASLFATAASAYATAGYDGEEHKHHQGGPTGYRSREWIAHPQSIEQLPAQCALAWNPSVTGTKVEDTCLLTAQGIETITSTPDWPAAAADIDGRTIRMADHLMVDG